MKSGRRQFNLSRTIRHGIKLPPSTFHTVHFSHERKKRNIIQKKSANNSKAENGKPLHFKSEAEEAEWLSSPAGRRVAERRFVKAMREGKVIVTDRRNIDEKDKEAMRAGAVIRYRNGLDIKPTDPAVLQELMDSVKAKKTQAVSLRIPVSEIEAAKKLAAKLGLGYQTLLKEIISKALHNA